MKTSSLSSVDRFDQEYPADLPEQLAWLETHLQVSRGRMLQLLGVSASERRRLHGLSWQEITKGRELQADRAEHILTHYLSFFEFDANKAAEFAKTFSGNGDESMRQLTNYLPTLAKAKSAAEQDEILVQAAQEEGASLLPAMAKLLGSSAVSVNGGPSATPPTRSPRGHRRKAQ